MKTIPKLQRTLQALLVTGISMFALSPAIAGDNPKLILQITVDQFRGDFPMPIPISDPIDTLASQSNTIHADSCN